MQHDQEMHGQHGMHDEHFTIYPPDLHSYPAPDFMTPSGPPRQRFLPADAFGSPHRHDQHEAEHVYDSPLTLDPSTLDLRSNSNDNPPPSATTSGSNNTTPTGSLRLAAYNLPNLSSSGVTTRRRARANLEQLQIQVGGQPEAQVQSPHQHHDPNQQQQSDMRDDHMHTGEMQMHVDDRHPHSIISGGMDHEQGHLDASHTHNMYAMLSDTPSHPGYYLSPEAFSNSPTSTSTPPDASPQPDLQANSPPSGLSPPNCSSASVARPYRPGSLSLGIPGSRSMPLIPLTSTHGSPGQGHMSPSHVQHPQLSSHPHMHPSPYYSLSHNAGSPGFPSTPTTSHHTQGSSSSSHSSGHTRYSVRGSPGPRGFGRGHARSSSYGTVSTMSVRSSSPASSVASAFTSLSGGAGGSAPASTSTTVGSPTTYGEGGDIQMPFANTSPRDDGSHQARAQSHPPLSMPTAHPALAPYSLLLPSSRKRLLHQGAGGYLGPSGDHFIEESHEPMILQYPGEYPSPTSVPHLHEDFQARLPPKLSATRTPHRKQKLANSDRKAICLYAKQHPSARQEDIAARYNVERSTISKILKNKERWLGCPDDDAKIARKRKPRFDDLELVLKLWVEGTKPQGILLSDALIRSKAKEEARRLGILEDKFKASSGWLENFKHRVGIRKGKYIGRDHWQEGSDSEAEESPLSSKHSNEQKMVWLADPAPTPNHATKNAWPMGVTQDQSRETVQTKEEDGLQPSASLIASTGSELIQSFDQGNEHGLDQCSSQQLQTADNRPASRQESVRVGVGMRKTRSRTLAEAREANIAGGPLSPGGTAPAIGDPPLAPADSTPRHGLSPSTSDSATTAAPDGREASAGLDAALDFIVCQPQGFATPEEVAVLKKLSRRMSRAELSRHQSMSSVPAGWNAPEES